MEQQLEVILRDILDDLKQLKAKNINFQNSLVTLINQINAFSKFLKEQKQPSSTFDIKSVEQALNNRFLHLENFIAAQTLNKSIEHKHHLHKELFISLILLFYAFFYLTDGTKIMIVQNNLRQMTLSIGH